MSHTTREWFRVDTVTHDFNLMVGLFGIHFRIDAVACGVCQNLKCLIESFFFPFGEIGAERQALPFLDHNFEEILVSRVNFYRSTQLGWDKSRQRANGLNAKSVDDVRNAPASK